MTLKVTVNSREVKNPLARFLISLVGLAMTVVVLVLALFLILPLLWFVLLTAALLAALMLIAVPRLRGQYRIIVARRAKDRDKPD